MGNRIAFVFFAGLVGVGCGNSNTSTTVKDAGGMTDVGVVATGGVAQAGGLPATGGVLGTGGLTTTGGTPRTGGIVGTGGIPATGGLPSTGGAAQDAGIRDTSVVPPSDAPVDAPNIDAPRADAAALSDATVAKSGTCAGPTTAALANAGLPAGYCAWTWASGVGAPRGITRNAAGDILVVDRTGGRILLLHDDNGNGVSETSERVVLATTSGLNHGIAISNGYLYASSPTTVFRWAYTGGRSPLGTAQTVVSGIPTGGHVTRTLIFDKDGNLYVSVGSAGNLDTDTVRSRILRYPATSLGTASTFAQGEAFATGLRNEVGLAFDSQGRLWGVENGSDNLNRTDLGGDIHIDNPGEELNLFAQAGRFYGYPYCWTEYSLPATVGKGRGTQWAYPSVMGDGTHTDEWCRTTTNNVAPAMVMQAHSAPLDIKFYNGSAFPGDMVGSAIVTFHGSWNRTPATGYKVVRIPFGTNGMPSGEPLPLLEYSGSGDTGSGWPHRPVGIEIGTDGRLYITSDESGSVLAIGYNGP